ncbi:MAG: hypothetical protein AAB774_02120 [Patescibacteria group bacterium]
MKIKYQDFKDLLPELQWDIDGLAEKLSLAGHETEVADKEHLNVTLTANRHDCQDIRYLIFDLAGVYGLKTVPELISFKLKEPIDVTIEQINHLLGLSITDSDLRKLEQLGFEVGKNTVTPPSFRDVATMADVGEEVARQIGYDQLIIQPLSKQVAPESSEYKHLLKIKQALASIGLVETATSSFTKDGVIEVNDPFSRDEPYLRSNLLTGLLKTLARNPYLKRAAFFEVGNVFTPAESTKLGIIIAGYKDADVWQGTISRALGQQVRFQDVDSAIASQLDVKQGRLSFLELSIDQLKPVAVEPPRSLELPLPMFRAISKFPPLVRDVTIENPDDQIFESLKALEGLLLVEAVDKYQERVTYRLIFQKMAGSYTELEIQAIDAQLKKFSD